MFGSSTVKVVIVCRIITVLCSFRLQKDKSNIRRDSCSLRRVPDVSDGTV